MNVRSFFVEAIAADQRLDREIVATESFRPRSRHRVRVAGRSRDLLLDEATHSRLARLLGYPTTMDQILPEEVADAVWASLWEHELRRPARERRIPERLRVSIDAHDNQIRGYQNADYVALSVANVAEALFGLRIGRLDFETAIVRNQKLDDNGLTLRFSFPAFSTAPRKGDVVEGGLEIVHSTTGHSPTRVRNYLHRLVCTNGMTTRVCVADRTLRLRTRSDDQFAQAEMIATLRALLEEAINQLEAKLQGFRHLVNHRVDPIEHINQIAVEHRLSKKVRDQLKDALRQDELGPVDSAQATMFDVVNAVSRIATHGQVSQGHGGDWTIPQNVRANLTLLSGTLAVAPVHLCPSCRRILSPSTN